ncbi:type I-E CRISPR-associated protein Cas6/Cse3/CasE [uncultured Thiohalocapsa sp.]|uniref:type I-E CRISPR-associated protein Cas6/Cse3/CasE n=1 Tax=uncultured Thiohalocapsa sp. TaxID=768990 RepID=UPI0025D51FF7|nr:type I-E CRISPR-associated protein Cas6/Cse3/CasE [uncultured Thiohalocapsa sp.]
MRYLSKIELRRGQPLRQLASAIPKNAYSDHQVIWRLMSDTDAGARDFLFRREQLGHWPTFYVLSDRQPMASDPTWQVATKPFTPTLAAGARLGFVLRANPVRTRKASTDPSDKRRYRDDVVMQAKRLEAERELDPGRRPSQAELVQRAGATWLADRAERNGFALEAIHVDGYRQHRLNKRGQQTAIRFSTLDYHGILRVLHADRFLGAVHKGIGPAKAFGCGLLLLRRV